MKWLNVAGLIPALAGSARSGRGFIRAVTRQVPREEPRSEAGQVRERMSCLCTLQRRRAAR
jgi:hypothetical protein